MTNYTELVKSLRCENTGDDECGSSDCPYWSGLGCMDGQLMEDAAAAIEALQAEMPKRGEWIKHPEVKNIYGGVYIECPFCGEKYVVQNVSDEKFCRNCGADLRAKMEVQDG